MKTINNKHTPFADGKFKGLWDSIQNSPYPWHYTLRWPWYFKYPSTRNHSGLKPLPDQYGDNEPLKEPTGEHLRLTFAGDIMVLNGDAPPILCEPLRKLIRDSDLFIANLEAPLGAHAPDPDKRNTFRFHMPQAFLENIQQQIGLDFSRWVLTNANNHSGDAGLEGFNQSISLLESFGVKHLGHKTFTNPFRIVEHNGFKLGFSGWTHWLNRDMCGQQPVLSGVDMNATSPSDFKTANELDFMIGLPHWEFEFQHFPRRKTRRLAQSFLSRGFDLLVGSHPHVLQPWELFNDKPCFYALGNFCGLGIARPVKIIPLLEVQLYRAAKSSETQIRSFQLHYFYQLHENNEIKIVPLKDIPPDLLQSATQQLSKVVQINPHAI
jgi:hypothetical protein